MERPPPPPEEEEEREPLFSTSLQEEQELLDIWEAAESTVAGKGGRQEGVEPEELPARESAQLETEAAEVEEKRTRQAERLANAEEGAVDYEDFRLFFPSDTTSWQRDMLLLRGYRDELAATRTQSGRAAKQRRAAVLTLLSETVERMRVRELQLLRFLYQDDGYLPSPPNCWPPPSCGATISTCPPARNGWRTPRRLRPFARGPTLHACCTAG